MKDSNQPELIHGKINSFQIKGQLTSWMSLPRDVGHLTTIWDCPLKSGTPGNPGTETCVKRLGRYSEGDRGWGFGKEVLG